MDDFPPGLRSLSLLLSLLLLLCAAGCQSARYTGAEPSARSFYEDPDLRQTYIGFDLNFTVEQPSPHLQAPTHLDALP